MNKLLLKFSALIILIELFSAQLMATNVSDDKGNPIMVGYTNEYKNEGNIYRTFEVTIDDAGLYYIEFWLRPAKYFTDELTTFKVYLNGDFLGLIKPTFSNWQAAHLEDKSVFLAGSGSNNCNRRHGCLYFIS